MGQIAATWEAFTGNATVALELWHFHTRLHILFSFATVVAPELERMKQL